MANNKNKKNNGLNMPGDIKVLPDKKPVESKPVLPMFNSHWRILGNPTKND